MSGRPCSAAVVGAIALGGAADVVQLAVLGGGGPGDHARRARRPWCSRQACSAGSAAPRPTSGRPCSAAVVGTIALSAAADVVQLAVLGGGGPGDHARRPWCSRQACSAPPPTPRRPGSAPSPTSRRPGSAAVVRVIALGALGAVVLEAAGLGT